VTTDAHLPDLDREQMAEVFRLLGDIDEFKGHWRKLKEIRTERLNLIFGYPAVVDVARVVVRATRCGSGCNYSGQWRARVGRSRACASY
jgi:hypothetical protein